MCMNTSLCTVISNMFFGRGYILHNAPKCLHQIQCHQNHIRSHYATALVTLCSANKVTTAGGTYSDLGSMYTDYEYRQALEHFCTSDDDVFPQKCYSDSAYSAGTCNLDLANGAIHPTTGLLVMKNNSILHVDCEKETIVICKNIIFACRRVQLLHDGRLPLGAGVLLRRRGKTIPLQR